MISCCSTYRSALIVTFCLSVLLISYNFVNVAGLFLFSVSWKPLCSSPSCCSLSWTNWVFCPKPCVFAFNSDSVISFVARSFVAILWNSMLVLDDKTPKLCIFWITFSLSLVSCLLLDRLVPLWSLECSRSIPYIDLVSIYIADLRLKEMVHLFRAVILFVIPPISPPRLQPFLAMVPINLIEFTMTYFDNKISLPEFRLNLLWQHVHCCQVNSTPLSIICVVIPEEVWQHPFKCAQMQFPETVSTCTCE